MRGLSLIIGMGLTACAPITADLPDDAIVSLSLCSDGYIHAFPELETRLAALFWQSKSALSVTTEHLKHLPQTDRDPERALAWDGATQISSASGPGDIDLKWGEDFAAVWDNLETLSMHFKTANPATELKARLAALPPNPNPPRMLYLDRSGATAGPTTFVDAVITAAGGENIVKTPGWQSPDTETLMQFDPDIIIVSFMGSNYSGVNDRAFRHAALADKIEALPHIQVDGKLWPCAGPGLVTAAEQISKAISEL